MTTYHTAVREVYRQAAERPADNLCCVPLAPLYLPGLNVPSIMHEMNYGCGTTIHPRDMKPGQTALYVGVGGGLEALQLAYFHRKPGGVIAVDPVAAMRDAARKNLELAAETNDWFDPSFVQILDGDALDLPLEDNSVGLAAQNCLFNIFTTEGDLEQALAEMYRVLKPAGVLTMSDPITPEPLPNHIANNDQLRAECLGGCLPYDQYVKQVTDAGFGAAELRSRRPYRMLDAKGHQLTHDILLETIEFAAFKTPTPADGPCVFTGQTALYTGPDRQFDDGKGHVLLRNIPLQVCDKTAVALRRNHPHLTITPPTWHYNGGGCC